MTRLWEETFDPNKRLQHFEQEFACQLSPSTDVEDFAWTYYHIETEEFDRRFPGRWSPRESETWIPDRSHPVLWGREDGEMKDKWTTVGAVCDQHAMKLSRTLQLKRPAPSWISRMAHTELMKLYRRMLEHNPELAKRLLPLLPL